MIAWKNTKGEWEGDLDAVMKQGGKGDSIYLRDYHDKTEPLKYVMYSDFEWNYQPSNSGLFRAYLDSDGDWNADDDGLAVSIGNGRVVVETTGEAGSRELEALKTEAGNLFARQEKERKDLVSRLLA